MRTPLTRRSALTLLSAAAVQTLLVPKLRAEPEQDWTTPMPPYRIAGNLYYVGSRDLASFLLTTSSGQLLINSNLVTSPPQIRASVEKLGFRWQDVKILLISHAHYDHCAGSAQILKESGAQYMVMDADVPDVESGGKSNFQYSNDSSMFYPPARVTHTLHDGEQVKLAETLLTAHKTAGHTKGCTTWTMKLTENGKTYDAVIVGSPNVLSSYNLVDDPKYPRMASDFAKQFRTLKSLPCDIFLGAHGGYYDMLAKYARLQAGEKNVFVDPQGYRDYIAERQQAFETELARQKKAKGRPA